MAEYREVQSIGKTFIPVGETKTQQQMAPETLDGGRSKVELGSKSSRFYSKKNVLLSVLFTDGSWNAFGGVRL